MKRTWILTLSALLVAAAPILADKTSTTLLNARTTKGPSSAIHAAASPAETGVESWFFQAHITGEYILAILEMSLDGGAHWTPVHAFRGDDSLFTQRACGGCRMRVNVEGGVPGKTGAISVWVTQSGALVPVITPALVPTVTP